MYWYKHDIDAYRRATSRLSLTEHGAYRLLMDEAYATEKPLPSDMRELCFVLRAATKPERDAIEKVVRIFFTETAEGWVSNRIVDETERYQKRAETNRALGAKGGRPMKTDSVNSGNRTETESVIGAKPNRLKTGNRNETLTINQIPEEEKERESRPSARTRSTKTAIDPHFAISENVREWAAAHGHTNLREHLAAFATKCTAHGYRYADWDHAFMNAIRDDWAGLAKPQHRGNGNGHDQNPNESRSAAAVRRSRERDLAASGNVLDGGGTAIVGGHAP